MLRVKLDPNKVDKATIANLHRFDVGLSGISQSYKTSFPPTSTQIKLIPLLNSPVVFDVRPAFPLAPIGTVKEMMAGRIQPVQDDSYEFIIDFYSNVEQERIDEFVSQILTSEYVEVVKHVVN